ncbi:hypothetical protein BD310DRAFT_920470, partial [Dichomitus squalens]
MVGVEFVSSVGPDLYNQVTSPAVLTKLASRVGSKGLAERLLTLTTSVYGVAHSVAKHLEGESHGTWRSSRRLCMRSSETVEQAVEGRRGGRPEEMSPKMIRYGGVY